MPEISISPDIASMLAGIATGQTGNTNTATNTGYLAPSQMVNTPQGQSWVQQLINEYIQSAGGGFHQDGTALNGSIFGLPDVATGQSSIQSSILQAIQGQGPLTSWVGGHQQPMVQSMQARAIEIQKDVSAANNETQKYVAQVQADTARAVAQGQIDAAAAQARIQAASQEKMHADEMAMRQAELTWTQEYGRENLNILHQQLALDSELGRGNLAVAQRLAAVQEGQLGLSRDQFNLDKSMKEADLRANPFNAVANALYTRGAQVPQGSTQYGQPTTTLDNSGQLPFLQVLNQQGGQLPMFQNSGSPLNSGGIGGNAAPNPNQISQQNFGNMSNTERGITESLGKYAGYNPEDYWRQMQNSWNTTGQGRMNFGGTSLG